MGIRRARLPRRRRVRVGRSPPGGVHLANTWPGEFPRKNLNADCYEPTSPVTTFPPNGYGVQDMIGNVWEWTADWYSRKHATTSSSCTSKNAAR
jgi:formylglycine-generating enzyme required for sulfatase activity